MPTGADDRRGAAMPHEQAGHRPEATRVFSRPGSAARGSPQDRTQPLSRREYPAADAAGERAGAGGGPEPSGGADPVDSPGEERTRVLRRRPAPPTGSEPPEEPESGGPRRGGGSAPRPRRRRRFRLRRIVAAVLLLVLAAPPATWAWVWYTARADERPASDAILVLGASQYNGRPSPVFEARLAHAAELYREGVAPALVTVGGNQPGDNYTEGGSGRDWLVEQGVPAGDIVAVEKGDDTLRSVRAVSGVFERQGWSSVVVVTDPWHSLRSREMAEDHGMEAATSPSRSGPAVIERETQLWYITRETASLWYYWIFGDSSDIEVEAA